MIGSIFLTNKEFRYNATALLLGDYSVTITFLCTRNQIISVIIIIFPILWRSGTKSPRYACIHISSWLYPASTCK